MQCLLLGATGRTGGRVLQRLEAEGAGVVTYGRRPGGGMRAMTGAIDDIDGMRTALDSIDTVISCLASANSDAVCSTATRTVVAAATRPLRYVIVSGASVEMPGDRRNAPARAAIGVMRLFMGGMLADRQAELAILKQSPLRWTALRPPRLTEATGCGAWRFDRDRVRTPSLSRDDLAGAVIEAVSREDLTRTAPFVSEGRRDG
jgi:nucleoside-diphosphate-sugar epimerase